MHTQYMEGLVQSGPIPFKSENKGVFVSVSIASVRADACERAVRAPCDIMFV